MKKAFITGANGQCSSYLIELLLEKDYEIYGMIRKSSTFNIERIQHLMNNPEIMDKRLFLYYGDMTDSSCINRLLTKINPDEIYNCAAMSHVKVSFDVPEHCADTDGIGVLRILDAIKENSLKTKFLQCSTSELFGGLPETVPQNEKTPMTPRSPYACSKLYAYWIVKNYKEAYNLHCSNAIMFNYESPRRNESFVTRKITSGIARILQGKQDKLYLGNLYSLRDWSYCYDTVRAMWLMLQQDTPNDYVISSNESHSIKEFVELAFKEVGIDIEWIGSGIEEKGVDSKTKRELVSIDSKYFRPLEVDWLEGDSTKIRTELGWQPKTSFKELVQIMMKYDLEKVGITL